MDGGFFEWSSNGTDRTAHSLLNHSTAAGPKSLVEVESTRALWSRLGGLAWPAILGNTVYSAVFMIETALIGRLGAESMSAAGVSNELSYFVIAPISAFSVGGLALVARATGRHDLVDAQHVARAVLLLSLTLSLMFMVLMLTSAEQLLLLIGADPEVVAIGVPYAQWFGVIHIGSIFMLSISNLVRGAGDTKSPLIAVVLQAVITGVVGYLLIFNVVGPTGLGVLAIAVAGGLARIAGCGYLLFVLRRSPLWPGSWRIAGLQPTVLRRVVRTGGPAALEEALKAGGKLILGIAALQFGAVAYAAYRIVGVPISITFLATVGMGMAAATAVGQCLGANRPKLAQRYTVAAVLGGFACTVGPGIVILMIPAQLLGMLTTDLDVIRAGEGPLRMLGAAVMLNAVGNVLPAALRGAGDTRAMMVVGFVAIWVARLPVAFLFAFTGGLGIMGLWMGHAAEIIVRSGGAYVRFRSGKWQHLRL
jgi:putative MATE family efflux protein